MPIDNAAAHRESHNPEFRFIDEGLISQEIGRAQSVALRALGFSNSRLRLVVQDLKRRRPHAVLAVNVNDRALVLDNQLPRIVPAEAP